MGEGRRQIANENNALCGLREFPAVSIIWVYYNLTCTVTSSTNAPNRYKPQEIYHFLGSGLFHEENPRREVPAGDILIRSCSVLLRSTVQDGHHDAADDLADDNTAAEHQGVPDDAADAVHDLVSAGVVLTGLKLVVVIVSLHNDPPSPIFIGLLFNG